MDFKKEILGAIQVITQQTVQKLCPNITFGIVKAVGNKNKCTVTVDGVEQNLTYYGNTSPTINQKYPVFVPFGNMSLGFIMTFGSGGGSGTNDHAQLINRDAVNQHPMSAINGLVTALNNKANSTDIPSLDGYATETYVGSAISSALASVGTVREITEEEYLEYAQQTGHYYIAYYVVTLPDGLYSYRPSDLEDYFFVKSSAHGIAVVYEYKTVNEEVSCLRIIRGNASAIQQVAYLGSDGINYGDSTNRQYMASTAYVDNAIQAAITDAIERAY